MAVRGKRVDAHKSGTIAPKTDPRIASHGEGSSIAAGCKMHGVIHFSGPVMIRGSVSGDISSDHLVVVEPGGKLGGRVCVSQLLVQGRVNGSVAALAGIELWTGGTLAGDVYTSSLKVDEGSFLTADIVIAADRPADHVNRANALQLPQTSSFGADIAR